MTGTWRPEAAEPLADRVAEDIRLLSTIVDDTLPGWTRRVFSEQYRAGRPVVARLMREAGLQVHVDAAGNVVGRLPGAHGAGAPPLVTGSHTDTVHAGGRFDGVVGVVGAIEVARRLQETGTRLDHDLLVVDFLGEEPNEHGMSCVGSRAVAGALGADDLSRADGSGRTLGAAMAGFGLDPAGSLRASWGARSVHGYVELHVEQGPVLERVGVPIGVVTSIAGIDRLLASFHGRADHAGTTPMDLRHDALAAAAEAVLAIERVGCGAPVHGVSTTGRLLSGPGAVNVVPQEATLWAELRSTQADWLSGVRRTLAEEIAVGAARRGVEVVLDWLSDQPPVAATPFVQDEIAAAAQDVGLAWRAMPSGAGHDAAHLALLGPMGMIFVPSVGGRSHVPDELTGIDDVVRGIHVLLATLVRLDRAPATRSA
ncbi:MAG TPA: M20 family metallo-hydrolase [Cellulomonas sp.]